MANINGTSGDDNLVGTAGSDVISPGLGNDSVDGAQGIDRLVTNYGSVGGDSGSSYIYGDGSGGFYGNLYSGNNSNHTQFTNIEQVQFTLGSGNDALYVDAASLAYASRSLSLNGGGGSDYLSINFSALSSTTFAVSGANVISNRGTYTNWESYNITLGGGTNSVTTGAGDDSITSTGGTDTIDCGAGNDSYNLNGTDTPLTLNYDGTSGTANGGTIANVENLSVGGSSADDSFTLGAVSFAQIYGGDGIDMLSVDFSAAGGGYEYGTSIGNDGTGHFGGTLESGGGIDDVRFSQIEQVHFTDSDSDNYLTVDASPLTNADSSLSLDGGGGSDTLQIDFSALSGTTFTVSGANVTSNRGTYTNWESYNIALGSGTNTVTTGAGNDSITSNGGTDTIDGGAGDDSYGLNGTDTPLTLNYNGTSGTANGGTIVNVENLGVSGGSADDSFTLGTVSFAQIYGGDGIDMLSVDFSAAGGGYEYGSSIGNDGTGHFGGTFESGDGISQIRFSQIEKVQFIDSDSDNYLTVDASPLTVSGIALSLNGGGGNDTLAISYAALTDTTFIVSGVSVTSNHGTYTNWETYNITLGGGINTVITGAGSDSITGTNGTNIVTAGDGDDSINGGSGIDILNGGAGQDYLYGNNGNDVLDGGDGDDSIDGGSGLDTASYADAGAAVTVRLIAGAQNTIGAGTDTLVSIENLTGSAFNDTLIGNGAANVLNGGAGDDSLNGGAGLDTASYAGAASGVTVSLALTGAQNTVGAGVDTLTAIENLTGSDFGDTLSGDGNANALDGGAGTDTLSYAGAGAAVTVSLAIATAQATGGGGSDTIANFENLLGSGFNDTLTGNAGDNRIEGSAGNDTLDGGAGIDTASYTGAIAGVAISLMIAAAQNTGGAGTDTLSNFENLSGSVFDDALTGSAAVNALSGGSGNDILDGGAGADTLAGGTGNDLYYVDDAGDVVTENAGEGSDEVRTALAAYTLAANVETLTGTSSGGQALTGNALDNTITGGAGNDVIDGGAGNDAMSGGAGNDVYVVDAAGDTVTEAAGGGVDEVRTSLASYTLGANLEALTGIAGAGQTLTGNDLDNAVTGGSGSDTIGGGNGNDTIDGGAGADRMTGGAGDDVFVVRDTGDRVFESAGGGTDTVLSYLAAFTLGANLENLTGALDTGQTLIGNAAANTIIGGGGGDMLVGGDGNDTLTGGGGGDVLAGGAGDDTLDGGAGSDAASYAGATAAVTLSLAATGAQATGGAGMDTLANIENLTGSNFNDSLTGDAGANVLSSGIGNDLLSGGAGDDTLNGGGGYDRALYADAASGVTIDLNSTTAQATGGSGMDTLTGIEAVNGSNFADVLTGDAHNNELRGGLGNDTLVGGGGNDQLNGGAGTDTADYSSAGVGVHVDLSNAAAQNTQVGSDTLTSIENLLGGAFNDVLTGSTGANVLNGGAGIDKLDGGLGKDTLTGGAGNDKFYFTTTLGSANIDTITDFTAGQDKMFLDHNVFAGLTAGALAAGAYDTGAAASDADDRIIYNSATGALLFDRDGNGSAAAVQFAIVGTGINLSATSFQVV